MVADETEAYRGNSGSEKATSDTLQHQSRRNGDELWPKGDDESAGADHDGARSNQQPFRTDNIKKLSPWQLGQQPSNATGTQHNTDPLLGPVLSSKKNGNERPKASQGSSHEKVDSVESPQALTGRGAACIERLRRRDRQLGVSGP